MRQAGIIAAAGIYALDYMIQRLDDDHRNAKLIANAVHKLNSPAINVEKDKVETNIILLNVVEGWANKICKRFSEVSENEKLELGISTSVLAAPKSDAQIRLVLHCDVSEDMASMAAQKICYVAKGKEFIVLN